MGTRIALAGNPNCGKTTMFNDLTGASQYVGNWPGVTVEKKEGKYTRDKDVTITDLPGIYSLSPYSPEEIVARDYLLSDEPNVVVNLVDATNLERNLYLTTQILDLGIPVVVALNMMDLVEKNGDKIDTAKLSRKLGCPVVETSALKGRGMDELVDAAVKAAKKGVPAAPEIRFADDVETPIAKVIDVVGSRVPANRVRWFAIKLLEGEDRTVSQLKLSSSDLSAIAAIRDAMESDFDDDAESIVTGARYDAIGDVVAETVKKSAHGMTTTQKIDRVVTNRVLGIPIFIAIMFLVYYLAVSLGGGVVTDWANDGISGDGWLYTGGAAYDEAVGAWEEQVAAAEEAGASEEELAVLAEEEPDPASGEYGLWIPGLTPVVSDALEAVGCAPWLQSLVVDGIVAGVGAVIGFIPQLIILFLLLSFLEACGYLARVAFVMDRIFRRFGLSGKSFIPMLIASGCGVPAVMATKTIENEKDRRMTVMTTTMIPCGAKMPIIALVFGALVGMDSGSTWWVAPLFYFLGLAAIIVSCIMLKKFRAFAGEVAPFIMETSGLPPAHGQGGALGHVGARAQLHRQSRYHHLPFHHRHLAPHELRFLRRFVRSARRRDGRISGLQPHGCLGQPLGVGVRSAWLRKLGVRRHVHHGARRQGECGCHGGHSDQLGRSGRDRSRPVARLRHHAGRRHGGHCGVRGIQPALRPVLRGHGHHPPSDDERQVDVGHHRLSVRVRVVRGPDDLPAGRIGHGRSGVQRVDGGRPRRCRRPAVPAVPSHAQA